MTGRYKIAEHTIEIFSEGVNDVWMRLEKNYEPFRLDEKGSDSEPMVSVEIMDGLEEIPSQAAMIYKDVPQDPEMLSLFVYRDDEGVLFFKIIQPYDTKERVILKLMPNFRQATVFFEKQGNGPQPWQAGASLTAAFQLAYYFSAQPYGVFLSHASCVVKEGKAYLFLGKSGTGKSTHSRMWQEAFPDVELLNDDHPILKVDSSEGVVSYGSPWSGKTPCYKNISAPVGAVVRIRRGESNHIRRLSPLEAYASLLPSMFNAPFDRRLEDIRHMWLEKMVSMVPCYELHCLPDTDAAKVCLEGIKSEIKK